MFCKKQLIADKYLITFLFPLSQDKRTLAISEVYNTEKSYVESLRILVNVSAVFWTFRNCIRFFWPSSFGELSSWDFLFRTHNTSRIQSLEPNDRALNREHSQGFRKCKEHIF